MRAASHRVLLHSRLISRKMPSQEQMKRRLQIALGDPNEPLLHPRTTPTRWKRCISCGWPTNSPSTCLGRSGHNHHTANGHGLIIQVEEGHINAVLSVESKGALLDLMPLSDGYHHCWVMHDVVYRVVVKQVAGEIIFKRDFVPSYAGPVLLMIDCQMKCEASPLAHGRKLQAQYDSLVASEEKLDMIDSNMRLTGCPILDEVCLQSSTRHDVLDRLRQTAKLRALARHPRRLCSLGQ